MVSDKEFSQLLESIQSDPHVFLEIEDWEQFSELQQRQLCIAGVRADGDLLLDIPERFQDRSLYMEAIRSDATCLELVPRGKQDRDMCMVAVKQNGSVLMFVADEYRDEELCKEAVKRFGKSILFVPEELLTPEVCTCAFENDGSIISYIPNHYKESDCRGTMRLLSLEAMQEVWNGMHDGYSHKHVPTMEPAFC